MGFSRLGGTSWFEGDGGIRRDGRGMGTRVRKFSRLCWCLRELGGNGVDSVGNELVHCFTWKVWRLEGERVVCAWSIALLLLM